MQLARLPRSLALANVGNNMEARIAMMAITTRSSMRVNPSETGRAKGERLWTW